MMRRRRRRRSASKSRCLSRGARERERLYRLTPLPKTRPLRPERDPGQDARLDLPEVLVVQQALVTIAFASPSARRVGAGGGGAGGGGNDEARRATTARGIAGVVGVVPSAPSAPSAPPVSTVPSAARRRRREVSPRARRGASRWTGTLRFVAPATRPMGSRARRAASRLPRFPGRRGSRTFPNPAANALAMPGPVGLSPAAIRHGSQLQHDAHPPRTSRGTAGTPTVRSRAPRTRPRRSGSSGTVRRTIPRAGTPGARTRVTCTRHAPRASSGDTSGTSRRAASRRRGRRRLRDAALAGRASSSLRARGAPRGRAFVRVGPVFRVSARRRA